MFAIIFCFLGVPNIHWIKSCVLGHPQCDSESVRSCFCCCSHHTLQHRSSSHLAVVVVRWRLQLRIQDAISWWDHEAEMLGGQNTNSGECAKCHLPSHLRGIIFTCSCRNMSSDRNLRFLDMVTGLFVHLRLSVVWYGALLGTPCTQNSLNQHGYLRMLQPRTIHKAALKFQN